ncbi:Flp pilus assembly protein CpaB [Sphingomonas colocasiae]|uniref:Flp pilus assembly protein CpaB n=1 Tax=Sphingomonas colocasiae TaxID=1848973 RepID=A0ABS7PN73_9SPHN|nr:Flp pilus assembly protein CpaB [Sphingomonas colocasiae]MBY8822760.1 Flp pilus assembly protein CpaB [Sphingomonas colocasiae]
MDVRKIALLVGALLIAAVTAFMAKSMFSGASAPSAAAAPTVPMGPEVLVATRAMPIGTIIEPDSFRFQPWPKDLIQSAYYLKGEADPATLSGTVVRYAITAGQPITQGALVKPGDRGFLAAALGPGMRAVTVSVGAATSVAGFVFPGDRVDLVLTQEVPGSDGPALKTSETIIRNLRVLATDQRTTNTNDEGQTEVKTFSTVTLEATPRIAEKIAVAQTIGQLSLSLRSIADNTAELERAIAAGEVTVPENGDPKAEKQMLLAIASRPIDTDTTFVTGADVSRFQRRSLPVAQRGGATAPAPSQGGAPVAIYTPRGPVVRVARGNTVTEVPVGGK